MCGHFGGKADPAGPSIVTYVIQNALRRRYLVLLGWIGLFLFSVSRILQSDAAVLPQAAAAAANVEARTSAAEPAARLVAIEQLQVGQRVRADAPTNELDLQFGSPVVAGL